VKNRFQNLPFKCNLQRYAAAVKALLKKHPDLEKVNADGRTALIASCWKGNHACTKAGAIQLEDVLHQQLLAFFPYPRLITSR
jgi:hypothetical protein